MMRQKKVPCSLTELAIEGNSQFYETAWDEDTRLRTTNCHVTCDM